MIKPLILLASLFFKNSEAADPIFEKNITDMLNWMKNQGCEFADVEIR